MKKELLFLACIGLSLNGVSQSNPVNGDGYHYY